MTERGANAGTLIIKENGHPPSHADGRSAVDLDKAFAGVLRYAHDRIGRAASTKNPNEKGAYTGIVPLIGPHTAPACIVIY